MAIKFATDAGLDLLTIDGSGGGTGMSPLEHDGGRGACHRCCYTPRRTSTPNNWLNKGQQVVDMAFAGGLAREDHIFKALALGAPFTKLVCMGRSLMIPGFVGSNVEGVLKGQEREVVVDGQLVSRDKVPRQLGQAATQRPRDRVTRPRKSLPATTTSSRRSARTRCGTSPYGAIAIWTLADKLAAGLQQTAGRGAQVLARPDRAQRPRLRQP